MELNDWILALHLLSAVALVAALTAFSVMIVALWRTDDPAAVTSFVRLGLVGNVLVTIGSLGISTVSGMPASENACRVSVIAFSATSRKS